jgi:hypothetical protein
MATFAHPRKAAEAKTREETTSAGVEMSGWANPGSRDGFGPLVCA